MSCWGNSRLQTIHSIRNTGLRALASSLWCRRQEAIYVQSEYYAMKRKSIIRVQVHVKFAILPAGDQVGRWSLYGCGTFRYALVRTVPRGWLDRDAIYNETKVRFLGCLPGGYASVDFTQSCSLSRLHTSAERHPARHRWLSVLLRMHNVSTELPRIIAIPSSSSSFFLVCFILDRS